MKKSKKIILLLSLFFMFIGTVSAKDDPFAFDWRDTNSIISHDTYSINVNLKYRNGYLTIYNSEERNTFIRYYDIDGNTIKEKKLNNIMTFDAITNDDNIYLLSLVPDYDYNPVPKIIKLDDDFSIEKAYYLDEEYSYDYGSFIGVANYIAPEYGMSTLSIVNNRLYILGEGFQIRSLDLDLETIKTIKSEETTMKKYFPGIYYLATLTYIENKDLVDQEIRDYCEYELEGDCDSFYYWLVNNKSNYYQGLFQEAGVSFISADTNDKYTGISAVDISCGGSGSWLFSFFINNSVAGPLSASEDEYGIAQIAMECPTPNALLGLLDKDGKTIWIEENKDYTAFTNVKLVGDYIVALGLYDYDFYGDIVIYDLDGNVVQTIENKKSGYQFLASTKDGFLATDVDASNQCREEENVELEPQNYRSSSCYTELTTEHYALPHNITVTVEGEGEVKANEQSFSGKKEIIEITPKAGYKVESVTVTDTEGNIIEVEDNSFTMPASDVTIAVKIVEEVIEEAPVIENPNTNAFPIVGLVILAVGLGYLVYKNYKKFKFLK